MPRSIPRPYLTVESKKWLRLTMRFSSRDFSLNFFSCSGSPIKAFQSTQTYIGLKHRLNQLRQVIKRISPRRLDTSDSSPPLSLPLPPQNSESQPFPLPVRPRPDFPVGERLTYFVEQWKEFTDNKWVLSIVQKGFRILFQAKPPLSSVPFKMSQSSSPLFREEIEVFLKKRAVERAQNLGTPGFYSRIFFVPKKNGQLRLIIDLSLPNRYTKKQLFKMETVKSIRKSMANNDWAVSIDLTDAYLHIPIHPRPRKNLRFVHEDQPFQFTALPFGMSLSVDFHQADGCYSSASTTTHYLSFSVLRRLANKRSNSQSDNILDKILHSRYSVGFIPNLKKSDLTPSQNFTFISMKFLSQQNLGRVPTERVETLILTIISILLCKQVLARTFLSLLDKISAAAGFVFLGRLHLRANVSSVCLETT